RLFPPRTAWEESHVLIQAISPCGIPMPLMDCSTAEAVMIPDARRRQFLTIYPTLAQDLGLLINLRRIRRPAYGGCRLLLPTAQFADLSANRRRAAFRAHFQLL